MRRPEFGEGDQYSGEMKKYIPYLVIFLIGAFAGMWAHRQYRPYEPMESIQRDTVIVRDTMRYSRLELADKTYRIDVPQVSSPSLVFYPVDKIDTVYKDERVYITMAREYRYTETDDAQIWHSGVDSTIDSLIVKSSNMIIKESYRPKDARNVLSAGAEVGYLNCYSGLAYLEYERKLHKNIGLYGRVCKDLRAGATGVTLGARLSFGW